MVETDQTDDVIRTLVMWANRQVAVRAMLLTSTRAIPDAPLDAFSDYDVILVVREVPPFLADRSWPEEFGEVLVAYWDPLETDPGTGFEQAGNVVQYSDNLKIDFSLWLVPLLDHIAHLPELPAELDAGYRVLADKDGLTTTLRPPTHTGYIPVPPDEAAYLANVNEFFVGVPYVAKCLLRNEVLPAKWCLDYDMRYVYLLPMLEWRMECDHGWSVSPGRLGKGLKTKLPPNIWAELELTYAGAGIEDNWESLFRMIALFRRVARDVAGHLGYTYPDQLDTRVTEHARRMRNGAYGIAAGG